MDRLNSFFDTYKLPLILCLLGSVLIVGGIYYSDLLPHIPTASKTKTPLKATDFPKGSLTSSKTDFATILIDISGAVRFPGVHTLASDSRVEDAVKDSGGFLSKANKDFIAKQLNLSAKLVDGQKIYIPFEGENSEVTLASTSNNSSINGTAQPQNSLVGINSGSSSDLDSLPGVGPATANKIIASRPYQSLEELVDKKAVSKTVFEKIKALITLN